MIANVFGQINIDLYEDWGHVSSYFNLYGSYKLSRSFIMETKKYDCGSLSLCR